MKCHYKVLEIETDADESQIKAAYRKLALKWHPDKNLDNVEYAKEQFQVVQQAYDVLSDRQERAWYDKHKDHILYGRDYQDSALDVFQYFTTSCFKYYNDGPNGFYTVYREVFEKIASEDVDHADDGDADSDVPPTFGFADSDYDEVVGPFYTYWSSYNTKRSYSWLNPHNIQEFRDRRAFKLIEKENKKVRQKAKKERNEEVRALVAFIRKRDPRVQENSKRMEAKIVQNRQKQEELSRQKRLERRKELDDAKPIAEWAKFDNVEKELKGIEKDLTEIFGDDVSDEELLTELDDNLFCVACNKLFRTAKGYENHEISKKHKQNVKMLKKTMTAEDCGSPGNRSTDSVDGSIHDEEINQEVKVTEKKKTKKPKNVLQTVCDSDSDIDNSFIVDVEEKSNDFGQASTKKQKRKAKNASPRTEVNDAINEHTDHNHIAKKDKAKGKSKNKDRVASRTEIDLDHVCVTCKSQFSSKNKLFTHLKSRNHGVYLSATLSSNNKQHKE